LRHALAVLARHGANGSVRVLSTSRLDPGEEHVLFLLHVVEEIARDLADELRELVQYVGATGHGVARGLHLGEQQRRVAPGRDVELVNQMANGGLDAPGLDGLTVCLPTAGRGLWRSSSELGGSRDALCLLVAVHRCLL